MYRSIFVASSLFILTGCAGLDISSLTVDDANKAHVNTGQVKGYIVYQPMIVVEISERELCLARNAAGKCTSVKTVCGIGDPKTMPDYSKPYLVNPKSGFGKAGVEVDIEDGWRLGKIKDESDNTELLSVLAEGAGIQSTENLVPSNGDVTGCSQSGLYRLKLDEGKMNMDPIITY